MKDLLFVTVRQTMPFALEECSQLWPLFKVRSRCCLTALLTWSLLCTGVLLVSSLSG